MVTYVQTTEFGERIIETGFGHLGEPERHNPSMRNYEPISLPYPYWSNVTGALIPYDEYYNTILWPSSTSKNRSCENLNYIDQLRRNLPRKDNIQVEFKKYLHALIMDESYKERRIPEFGLVHRLFVACRALRLRACANSECVNVQSALKGLMPGCRTWKGFEDWVVQFATCICSHACDHSHRPWPDLVSIIASVVNDYRGLRPSTSSATTYTAWAETIDLSDVLSILSWLKALSIGIYEPVREPVSVSDGRYPEPARDELFHEAMGEALERIKALGLCPRRVWAVVANLPGRELNLPALIPTGYLKSFGHGHITCTPDFCEESVKNFTSVKQLHVHMSRNVPSDSLAVANRERVPPAITKKHRHFSRFRSFFQGLAPSNSPDLPSNVVSNEYTITQSSPSDIQNEAVEGECTPTQGLFPPNILNAAVKAKCTAWSLDGRSILSQKQSFMAISHVWADGTGTGGWPAGCVNRCLWEYFCSIARQLECDGVWWDTVCIPRDPQTRSIALNNMHVNYATAKVTLVHDLYLRQFPWVDAESACFAVLMSSWFTRGWTALELAKSRRVKVVFKSVGETFVIKDLDDDILAKPGEPSSPSRQVATTAIRALRTGDISSLNDLLITFKPRYTSWEADKAVIAGLLVGLDNPASKSKPDVFQSILRKFKCVADAHLFHDVATMSGNQFTWCSTSLLDMPIATGLSTDLYIKDNGDVVGYWGLLSNTPVNAGGFEFVWKEGGHSLVELKVKKALKDRSKHAFLVERRVKSPTRALVVKLMKKSEEQEARDKKAGVLPEVCGQYIGCVYFSTIGEHNGRLGELEVRIGDTIGMVELSEDEMAYEYAAKVWEERKRLDPHAVGGIGLPMGSVGPRGIQYRFPDDESSEDDQAGDGYGGNPY